MNWKPSDAFDYAKGNLEPAREQEFKAALENQPELLRAVEDAQSLLKTGADALEASETIHARRVLHGITHPEEKTMAPHGFRWFVPALALLCLSIISTVLFMSQEPAHSPLWAFQPPPGEDHAAERVWLPLADGSSVGPSKLAVWTLVNQEKGNLTLSLEAGTLDCKVTKKTEGQDFKVRAHGVEVTVVGTEFSVEATREGVVTVSVSEGIVEVRHKGFEGNLEAGQSWSTEGGVTSKKSNGVGSPTLENPEAPGSTRNEAGLPVANKDTQEKDNAVSGDVKTEEKPKGKARNGAVKDPKTVPENTMAKETGASPQMVNTGAPESKKVKAPSDTIEIKLPHQSQEKPVEVASNEAKAPSDEETDKAPKTKNIGAIAALAKMKAGKYDDALRDLQALQGKSVQHRADLLYLQGYCHHKKGDVAMARSLWTKMDGLDPNNPWLPKVGSWLNPPTPSAAKLR